MITAFIIGLATFLIYVIAIIIRFGVPSSLSDSFYLLKKAYSEYKLVPYLFTLVLWITSFTILPVWLEYSNESIQFLAFFAAAGLALVGAAPVFHNPFTHFGHVVGAWLAAVCGTLWAFLQYISMYGLIGCSGILNIASVLALTIILVYNMQNDNPRTKTFWAEMWAFSFIFISVGINLILNY